MDSIRTAGIGLACALAASAVAAQDLPARKPGLWEMSMQMAGMPSTMGSQHCVDEKSDADLQRRAFSRDGKEKCTQKSFKRSSAGYEMQVECTGPEGRSIVDAKVSGDFGQSYRMVNHVRFEPPRHGMQETSMEITARHAGACPASMKPGETRTAGMGGMAPGGAMTRPGGAPGGMPAGMDPNAMKGMTPEQLRQMAEQMKKARGN